MVVWLGLYGGVLVGVMVGVLVGVLGVVVWVCGRLVGWLVVGWWLVAAENPK